jgi:hypothetical protein
MDSKLPAQAGSICNTALTAVVLRPEITETLFKFSEVNKNNSETPSKINYTNTNCFLFSSLARDTGLLKKLFHKKKNSQFCTIRSQTSSPPFDLELRTNTPLKTAPTNNTGFSFRCAV